MSTTNIHITQADIIYKALHYVALHEKIEIPDELEKVFRVLAEENPRDTQAEDTLDVMAFLSTFIRNDEAYAQYFEEEDDDKL